MKHREMLNKVLKALGPYKILKSALQTFCIRLIFNFVFREIFPEFRETKNQKLGNNFAVLQKLNDFLIDFKYDKNHM